MDRIQENKFQTHNYAKEVLNKQKAKRAELTNSESLKPYIYPNDAYYDRSKT